MAQRKPELADDLITEMLDRIAVKLGILPKKLTLEIERELRRDLGGETYYIAKHGESARQELAERDARIRSEARRGEHIPLLARRHHLSERRVQQIIARTAQQARSAKS